MNNSTAPTIIVGGGFVGLFTALHLSHRHYSEPIILIDSQERFVFKPLLFEYLTGEMQDEQVFPRYEELLEGTSLTFIQDQVTTIDLPQSRIQLASGLHYDYRYLVLGVGSIQGYFGTKGAKENAFAFRTQEDAISLEGHLRECLQQACQTENSQDYHSLLTIAVVGAGPSGVEMAATLADLLPSWYDKLGGNIRDIRIVLINHGTEILSGDINAHLQETALEALKSRTVTVELCLGVKVIEVEGNGLKYQQKDQEAIETLSTHTTIWTAGTATNPLIESLGQFLAENKDKHGLPLVTPTLQLPDFPKVFAAGDCAVVKDHPFPPVAQIAYQQGGEIADNLIALSQGKNIQPINPTLRGTLMKLGINNGVADLFDKIQVTGKTGDLIRNGTYLELLPTPIHNFKATTNWLTDEIFHRHHLPKSVTHPPEKQKTPLWIWGLLVAIALVTGYIVIWRTNKPSPQQQPDQKPVSSKLYPFKSL
ncbi:NAD(P)/FAD-dependent oxidoreductase [Crocosphaera sp. UHCC 0190]|uniref:NAD(P)/FAD-dependent oxidoreductase n=1 Tax=Crocosphaera sp. UHCC 0190 TaxID=3110246 RepID=UPI002B1F605E|nr:NAD(P)/FAD-dependent oxidoreductase [Crocosphaera sp. UHCC 0190]MEA5508737.1 NAD(P)/FAD-dependent oxidoreductase [Crocosphaera sp. UHCC 0190]